MKWVIRRTYLVRRSQVFECEMPDEMDPEHLASDHRDAFSLDLQRGGDVLNGWTAKCVSSDEEEELAYDEEKLEVISRQHADVIPIRRGKP